MEHPRKAPAVEKDIAEITEEDIKVRVIGTVKSIEEGYFTLKDETGDMRVESQEKITEDSRVRVFGRPTRVGDELMLSAELIQDMSCLDEKLYKKIKSQGI